MSSCLRSSRSIHYRYKRAQPPLYQRALAPLLPAACPGSRLPAHLALGWQHELRKVVTTGLLAYSMVVLQGGSGPELRRGRRRQQERNPSKEGKRGWGARAHWRPVAGGRSHRRCSDISIISPPPSPFSTSYRCRRRCRVSSLSHLLFPRPKTRGCPRV
jgi:hypothetical protein